jgi:hypothetical protein
LPAHAGCASPTILLDALAAAALSIVEDNTMSRRELDRRSAHSTVFA